MSSITLIGGGVVGLTASLELARAGHRVTCLRDRAVEDTVSRVAGGLWFPYHVEPRDLVGRWGRETLEVFRSLAASEGEATGVRLQEGVFVHRGEADLWWAEGLERRWARPDELPPGAPAASIVTVPLVDTGRLLPWLEASCAGLGVLLERGHVGTPDTLADLDADLIVICAGRGSGPLVGGDDDLAGGRGQVVRLANPGLTRWVVDDENPAGLTYVLPHPDGVVCGGTDDLDSVAPEPDPDIEAAILARCTALVPELAGAEIIGRAVGWRPVAPSVRLARIQVAGRDVITNYGHGGAGVTLAWGCAAEVVRLADAG